MDRGVVVRVVSGGARIGPAGEQRSAAPRSGGRGGRQGPVAGQSSSQGQARAGRGANVGAVAGERALPAVPEGEGFFGRVRVQNILRDLHLETVPNIGQGNCFAWAVEDASSRNIPAAIVRPRARDFISNNPRHPCVSCLSDEESADIDEDGIEITDQQAQIFALCFKCDFLFLDVPSSTARLVDRDGGTRYLDGRVCRRVLHNRRNDVENPLHIIKYTPGHYEGVRWPRRG